MEIKNLKVNINILKALNELGFNELTEIQDRCIPKILEGKDIFGHSSTGSGKTAAFGIPILDKIVAKNGLQLATVSFLENWR